MRFSTRTRYGLRFLLRLAAQPQGSLLQLGQVAREENILIGLSGTDSAGTAPHGHFACCARFWRRVLTCQVANRY